MILRSGVRIPVPYTGWKFFHINLLQNCIDICLKKTENKRKRGRGWPISKNNKRPRLANIFFKKQMCK